MDKLEAELNSYKTNLIKESIRMGYNELGDLSYRRWARNDLRDTGFLFAGPPRGH